MSDKAKKKERTTKNSNEILEKQPEVETEAYPTERCNRCGAELGRGDEKCPKCLAPTNWKN